MHLESREEADDRVRYPGTDRGQAVALCRLGGDKAIDAAADTLYGPRRHETA